MVWNKNLITLQGRQDYEADGEFCQQPAKCSFDNPEGCENMEIIDS